MKIKKASGKIEELDPDKLLASLVRSGTDREKANEVIKLIIPEITPLMSTKKIFRIAHKYLKKLNRVSPLRYSLKNALLRLGPTGYPFEKYIGELFKQRGYQVSVGVTLDGKCVSHEVDVYAVNDREIILVECKYRSRVENAPDVKVAMYVHSRFRDLFSVMKQQYPDKSIKGWLVTNTRFTSDAVQYARCSNLHLMSWRYPEKNSLEKMIEGNKLYPVTILSSLKSSQIRKLFDHHIVLMKDLAVMEPGEIKKLLEITGKRALSLKQQADELCFCN